MDGIEVTKRLQEKGYLIAPEALNKIISSENPEELEKTAIQNAKDLIIKPEDLEIKEKTKIAVEEKVVIEKTVFKPIAEDVSTRIKILDNYNSKSTGLIEDFVDYFRDRCEQITEILKTRGENSLVKISDLRKKSGKVRIIGIIMEKRTTKNGHIFLKIEDLSGSVSALIPAGNNELISFGNTLVLDEIIAAEGRLSKELFIVNAVHQPDTPMKKVKTTEEEIGLVLLSDLHIGSNLFLEKNFEHFLFWLKGEIGDEKQRELASKVKYITIAGDLTDGIGIYPGQEKELILTDIYAQYAAFSEYIKQIPEYIHVIISSGNHDAVRKADPQPSIPKELVEEIHSLKNVLFVSSPSMVELHGIKTLIYHGTSFDDLIAAIPSLNYEQTEKVMVEVLKRRHVHPIYGEKPIMPEKHDSLVISEVPDIFHSGHLHKNGYENYKGILCVNSGTWQQVTSYQIKQGHKVTPCIVPFIDLNAGKVNIIHFDKPM